MKYLFIILVTMLAGCTTISDEVASFQKKQIEVLERKGYEPETLEGTLHQSVERMARQLFDTSIGLDVHSPVVVGTFLPVSNLEHEKNSNLQRIGLQIQESFITLSTQAGLKVIEHRALPSIMMTPNSDVMLSRTQVMQDQKINAGYMLTGTYSIQQNSLMVNARLIRIEDKSLVAAATDYIATNSMWSHSKVQLNDNQIYRGEY